MLDYVLLYITAMNRFLKCGTARWDAIHMGYCYNMESEETRKAMILVYSPRCKGDLRFAIQSE